MTLPTRQISYPEALKQVIDRDGVLGLFVRGLQTRILANALQVKSNAAGASARDIRPPPLWSALLADDGPTRELGG